jgi:hypothetical protein
VQGQAPWQVCAVVLARSGVGVGGLRARVQVVQQAERVVPFERDVFVREPEVCGRAVGVDEGGREESVQAVREEREVGEARELYLSRLL